MKLYSLLILTENTKKSKNNCKVLKKSEIVVFLYFVSHSQDTGGHTCSTDCLPNAGPMPSACGPML